jgi:hypothetical protein
MKFRKKPVIIEAIPLVGIEEAKRFIGIKDFAGIAMDGRKQIGIFIKTFEGQMLALKNDFLIRGVNGEHYSCKPDIFEKTYEAVQ